MRILIDGDATPDIEKIAFLCEISISNSRI